MSMISGLIDRLRIHADLYDGKTQPPMNHELQRPYLAQELREAADTIWQLRDDLQRANDAVQDAEHDESIAWDRVRKAEAENAKLREELEAVGTAAYLYGRTDLEDENAKLRELVRELYEDQCCDGDQWKYCDRMRELGVEVDE